MAPTRANTARRGRVAPPTIPARASTETPATEEIATEEVDLEAEMSKFEEFLEESVDPQSMTPAVVKLDRLTESDECQKEPDDSANEQPVKEKVVVENPATQIKSILKKGGSEVRPVSADYKIPSKGDTKKTESSADKEKSGGSTSEYKSIYDELFPHQIRISNMPIRYNMKDFISYLSSVFKTEIDKAMTHDDRKVVMLYFKDKTLAESLSRLINNRIYQDEILCAESWPPAEGLKRKHEEEIDSAIKKPKTEDLTAAAYLQSCLPYINVSYDDQKKMITREVALLSSRLHSLLCYRNKSLAGWAEASVKENGGTIFKVDPVVTPRVIRGYRKLVRFKAGKGADGKLAIGFPNHSNKKEIVALEPGDKFIDIPDAIKLACKLTGDFLRSTGKSVVNRQTKSGTFDFVRIRETPGGGVMILVSVFPNSLDKVALAKIKVDMKEFFVTGPGKEARCETLFIHVASHDIIGVASEGLQLIMGQPEFELPVFDLKFSISPYGMIRTSNHVLEALLRSIEELAHPFMESVVVDVHAGSCAAALYLSKKCEMAYALEVLETNVVDAITTKAINSLKNVEIVQGKVESTLPKIFKKIGHKSQIIVVIEPPRSGMDITVVDLIRAQKNVKRIVYVTNKVCLNTCFHLDFMDLCASGGTGLPFLPLRVIPVDTEPFTLHKGCVFLLERVDVSHYPKATAPAPKPNLEKEIVDRKTKKKVDRNARIESGRGRGGPRGERGGAGGRRGGASPSSSRRRSPPPRSRSPIRGRRGILDRPSRLDDFGRRGPGPMEFPNEPIGGAISNFGGPDFNQMNPMLNMGIDPASAMMMNLNPILNMPLNPLNAFGLPMINQPMPEPTGQNEIISAYERRIAELEEKERIRQYEQRIAELEEQDRISKLRQYEQRIQELEQQVGQTGKFERAGGFHRGQQGSNAMIDKYESRIAELENLASSGRNSDNRNRQNYQGRTPVDEFRATWSREVDAQDSPRRSGDNRYAEVDRRGNWDFSEGGRNVRGADGRHPEDEQEMITRNEDVRGGRNVPDRFSGGAPRVIDRSPHASQENEPRGRGDRFSGEPRGGEWRDDKVSPRRGAPEDRFSSSLGGRLVKDERPRGNERGNDRFEGGRSGPMDRPRGDSSQRGGGTRDRPSLVASLEALRKRDAGGTVGERGFGERSDEYGRSRTSGGGQRGFDEHAGSPHREGGNGRPLRGADERFQGVGGRNIMGEGDPYRGGGTDRAQRGVDERFQGVGGRSGGGVGNPSRGATDDRTQRGVVERFQGAGGRNSVGAENPSRAGGNDTKQRGVGDRFQGIGGRQEDPDRGGGRGRGQRGGDDRFQGIGGRQEDPDRGGGRGHGQRGADDRFQGIGGRQEDPDRGGGRGRGQRNVDERFQGAWDQSPSRDRQFDDKPGYGLEGERAGSDYRRNDYGQGGRY